MPGIVYVLTHPAMPGLVKIGRTNGSIEERMRGLDSTSLPFPFECFYAVLVNDPDAVERAIHEAFDDHRVNKRREFFKLSPDRPKAIMNLVKLKVVTPGHDIVEQPEDQQALDEARTRRSKLRMSEIGVTAGALLQSVFDEATTATVIDDGHIDFRGQPTSLSRSALIVAHEQGYGWKTIAGPYYWKYEGRTLGEIRDKLEEGDD